MADPLLFQLPQPKAPIDQGATRLQTFPVPPIEQPPDGWFGASSAAYRNVNLWLAGPRPQLDGATRQQTFPVPVTAQPPAQWYHPRGEAARDWRRMPGSRPFLETVATVAAPQTYLFLPNQPELAQWLPLLHGGRFRVEATKRVEGATTQQTFPVPPVTTRPDPWFVPGVASWRDVNVNLASFLKQFDGPTAQATFPIPPIEQPPDQWFGPSSPIANDVRRHTGPKAQLEGAISQQTYLFAPSQPEPRYYVRNTPAPIWNPLETIGTVVAPQSYTFPVNQPELARWTPVQHALRFLVDPVRAFDGPTSQQTYTFAVDGPLPARFAPGPRQVTIAADLSVSVAIAPQTYEFALSQPVFRAWPMPTQPKPAAQLEGPVTQQTYVFAPNQPSLWTWPKALPIASTRPIEGPPTSTASFDFQPNQPELQRFDLLRTLHRRSDLGPRKQLEGATVQGYTFTLPVSGPEFRRWTEYVQSSRIPGARMAVFEGFIAPPLITRVVVALDGLITQSVTLRGRLTLTVDAGGTIRPRIAKDEEI